MTEKEKKEESKDYIINLRVSRATYDKVKQKAKENRETVSNLLRKVIDDSAEIVTDFSDELFGRGKKGKFADVETYAKVQMARDTKCAECGGEIGKSETATAGESRSGRKYYFCKECRQA